MKGRVDMNIFEIQKILQTVLNMEMELMMKELEKGVQKDVKESN